MTAQAVEPAPRLGYVTVGAYEGPAMVVRGHGLPAGVVEAIARDGFGEGEVHADEAHWWEQKRVMWCSRHGDPCDSDGEWHTHWHGLMPNDNPATHFTVIWVEPPDLALTDSAG